MLSRCFLDFSVVVGAFVIGLSQISSFSLDKFASKKEIGVKQTSVRNPTFHHLFIHLD